MLAILLSLLAALLTGQGAPIPAPERISPAPVFSWQWGACGEDDCWVEIDANGAGLLISWNGSSVRL